MTSCHCNAKCFTDFNYWTLMLWWKKKRKKNPKLLKGAPLFLAHLWWMVPIDRAEKDLNWKTTLWEHDWLCVCAFSLQSMEATCSPTLSIMHSVCVCMIMNMHDRCMIFKCLYSVSFISGCLDLQVTKRKSHFPIYIKLVLKPSVKPQALKQTNEHFEVMQVINKIHNTLKIRTGLVF